MNGIWNNYMKSRYTKNIVYYVASSLDGYTSGENEDASGFVGEGNAVEKYLSDLKEFDSVIMGRKTYEFGYRRRFADNDL